ncbi:PREDICTED: T-cell surface glycoprotein CD1e, membrane-associated-like [Lepidothrix coronata]|uniref:T-cell surface glycoprotein CD1e, membrane-associated-like n=1 Tax=Lepidothrix coronata TaxID=321398 RepID=A0A6J0IKA3_9PASS|nr:PREDICTED: T-cell surface glycoprotein CD1e, membrane-associated-like [Lepidothrix coronata]
MMMTVMMMMMMPPPPQRWGRPEGPPNNPSAAGAPTEDRHLLTDTDPTPPTGPAAPSPHTGPRLRAERRTFTFRLLHTSTFQNTSFVETEGIGLLEDIELGSLDKHTWDIHFCQPWVRPAVPQSEWDTLDNMFKVYLHNFNLLMNQGATQKDVPYPFVAQSMAGCKLYPNRTSQVFLSVGYNGQDFLSLDTDSATWTLSQDTDLARYLRAVLTNETTLAEAVEGIFKDSCINALEMFLSYGRAALERQGTFTIRLLQTSTFQNTSFVDTEGIGLLEDIELGSLDKHTWDIHFCQPWVLPALSRSEWDTTDNMIKIYMHQFNRLMNEGAIQKDVPYPFVAQSMAGCKLYPNRTSQVFVYLGYNGQNFLSLDTDNDTWTIPQDTGLARYVRDVLQNETTLIKEVEGIFNNTCINAMEMFLSYGRAALERQGETTLTLPQPPQSPGAKPCPTRDGHSYACRVRHRSLGTRSLLVPWGNSQLVLITGLVAGLLGAVALAALLLLCLWRRRKHQGTEESQSRNSILSKEA